MMVDERDSLGVVIKRRARLKEARGVRLNGLLRKRRRNA
jgi:hypothetical protein